MKDNLDWVHHDSKTSEPLEQQVQKFTHWIDPTIEKQQKEIDRLNNIIDELENILNLMIYQGYYDIPKPDYEGTSVQGFITTGENSEFGIRAKFILNKLNELKENNIC